MTATPEMKRIASGSAWNAVGIVGAQVLSVAGSLVAARALPPDAFGALGMALVVTTLLQGLRDMGIAPAIASGRVKDDATIFAAHWLVCGATAAVALAVVAAAPIVAAFFGSEEVASLLRVQMLGVLFGSAVAIPQALLQRDHRFGSLAVLGIVSQALVTAGIVAALALRAGVWALVLPGVVAAAVMAPMYWLAIGRAPPLVLWSEPLRRLVKEGLQVSASSLFSYVIRNADKAIIGRLNGQRELGLYTFGYNFLLQPLAIFSHAFVPVLLPAFGRLEDRAARSDGVVRVTLALVRIGTPFMVGGAMVAPLFVPLLFGAQWSDAVPLVVVLMLIGATQIPGPVFGSLCFAIGDARFILVWTAGSAAVSFVAYAAGALAAGAMGVAVAYLLFTIGQLTAMYAIARRRFGLPLRGLARGLVRVARDLLVMVGAVAAMKWLGGVGSLTVVERLGMSVLVGVIAYVGAVRVFAADEARLLVGLLPGRIAGPIASLLRLRLTRG
jgi:PST family polysaccharide transporter